MAKKVEQTTEYELRPPIVTLMGHVDHGKTSLLDAIRKTNVTAQEHAGITQHIGAYQISYADHKITFIDTPGHAAFAQMRSRGGKIADIIILIVSAEESVMPQTREAIDVALASKAQIIVAITKIDLPNANSAKVKQALAEQGLLVESLGGNVVCVEVSAKTGKNLDKLLEAILTVSELLNLKTNSKGELEAVIVESRMDKKRGVMVACIVKNGTLTVGDKVVASGYEAPVRSLSDDKGVSIKSAGPSTPVEILGFSKAPNVGDLIMQRGSELASLSIDESRIEIVGKNSKRTVAVILKSDTQGTLEAVKGSLAELVTSSVNATFSLKFLACSTGEISNSEVMLAHNAKALIVGFNVKASQEVLDLAESYKVRLKTYKTIYELTDEVRDILENTAEEDEAKIRGRAKVLKTFKLDSGDIIVGCRVIAGALKEDAKVSIYDKNPADLTKKDEPLYTGIIKKLKKGKENVTVVGKDNDCGVLLRPQFEAISDAHWLEIV